MQVKYQWYVGSLCLILLSAACAVQPETANEPVTAVPSVTIPAPVIPSQTPTSKFISKHNDLIFIEFFAIT